MLKIRGNLEMLIAADLLNLEANTYFGAFFSQKFSSFVNKNFLRTTYLSKLTTICQLFSYDPFVI